MAKDKPTLLLFSTSRHLRESLGAYLANITQFTLVEAVSTTSDALTAIARRPPALIILDLYDQDEEAARLTQSIKAQWPCLRCLVLTQSPTGVELARAAGAEGGLIWGFLPEKLDAEIERLISVGDAGPPASSGVSRNNS